MTDWRPMQKRLGVTADGIPGRGTIAALFKAMGATAARAASLALGANVHFRTHGIIDNPLRLAHFMGQTAHESAGFLYMEELGGDAYFKRMYDMEGDRPLVAKRLGNVVPGDGIRYHGRGPIQLTGRANYREYGQTLGLDFEDNPQLVAMPAIGILVAAKYWADRGINALADADDLEAITRKINGGVNGLADRQARTAKAKGLILP